MSFFLKKTDDINDISVRARCGRRAGFLGIVLNTLLAAGKIAVGAISGAISVLLSSPDMPEKNLSMLQDIKTDADDLIVMVENLLSVTRIQDGTTPLIKHEEML